LCGLELDIACGLDRDGNRPKAANIAQSVNNRIRQAGLSSDLKLRLLMLHLGMVSSPIKEQERDRLVKDAELTAQDISALRSFLSSGITGFTRSATSDKARQKRLKNADSKHILARFEPYVKQLLEELAEKRLSEDDFPRIGKSEAGLRLSARPDLEKAGTEDWGVDFQPLATSPDDMAPLPPCTDVQRDTAEEVSHRFIVFIAGGVCFSELRAGVELQQSLPAGVDILVGGTSLLTPNRFIQQWRTADATAAEPVNDTAEAGEAGGLDLR
jgi:hypothetical protein